MYSWYKCDYIQSILSFIFQDFLFSAYNCFPSGSFINNWQSKKGFTMKIIKSLGSTYCLQCFSIIICTISGSASVDISPRSSIWFPAIFLSIRLMIFPDLVLGRPGVKIIYSGIANPSKQIFIFNPVLYEKIYRLT